MKTILLLTLTCLTLTTQAVNYYVSTTGNDANAGTIDHPWRTVQKAANSAIAGSTVYIRQGTYFEKVSVNVSGMPGNYITFTNYPNETATLDGTGVTGLTMFDIYNTNYIKVIGLEIKNCVGNNRAGILVEYGARYIEIRNCKVSGIHFSANPNATPNANTNANPILVYGDHPSITMSSIIIDGNEVFDCRPGYSEALTIDGNVTNFQITHNYVHNIKNIGIDMAGHFGANPNATLDQARNGVCTDNLVAYCGSPYATAAGIYVDGGKNIVIERNVVHHCQWGIEVGCENVGTTASSITVRNNLLYKNANSGLAFGGYAFPSGSGRISACKFYNNTLWSNDTTNSSSGEVYITSTLNCIFKNNIIYSSSQNKLIQKERASSGLVLDYNNWFTPGGSALCYVHWGSANYHTWSAYQTGSAQDAHSIFANPVFASTLIPDLHIAAGSPAINAGDPAFVPAASETDIDGDARVLNARVDCGADERPSVQELTSGGSSNTLQLNVWPNPATTLIHLGFPADAASTWNLQVYDVSGRLIFRKENISSLEDIDCTSWEKGMYLLTIQNGREMYSRKVEKK